MCLIIIRFVDSSQLIIAEQPEDFSLVALLSLIPAEQTRTTGKLNTSEHKQKLIDFFVNSIFLYNDKFVIMLNFKGGEKTIRFDDLNEGIKKEHPIDECSSLLRCGDPYGN